MIFKITSEQWPILKEIPKLKDNCIYVEAENENCLDLLKNIPYRTFGIVGSRAPQHRSLLLMNEIIRPMRGSSVIIVSGMAKGIDAEAHRLALKYQLKTIGVLGHGFHDHYPSETENLRKEILRQGGLMISEYAPEIKAMPYQFIHRNRIISALSRAAWVVQAGKTSGALNTAKWTLEMARDLFITPCFPGDSSMMGNEFLMKQPGTKALWSSEDLSCVWIDLFSKFQNQSLSEQITDMIH